MREQKLWHHIIGITLSLFVLAGCGVSPEQPTASPSATPTEGRQASSPEPTEVEVEVEIVVTLVVTDLTCPCFACVNLEAWEDQNENGTWDRWEVPLVGVNFFAETSGHKRVGRAKSDSTGKAGITVKGCNCDYFEVYPEAPPGYRLTTVDRLANTRCREGEDESRPFGACRSPTCSFGFAVLPETSRIPGEADLREGNLSAAYLREADLGGADLSGADLRQADLSEANLSGANLSSANLAEADLTGADLSQADLSEADLSGAVLGNANLLAVDLSKANLSEANLLEANLSRANLTKANLLGADLVGTNLTGANLREALLIRADLTGADLCGADLFKASLLRAGLPGAKYDQDTKWPEGFDPVAAGAVLEQ